MKAGCILIEQGDAWRVIAADTDAAKTDEVLLRGTTDVSRLATDVADAVQQLGCKPRLVVAPDSGSSFFATVKSDGNARLSDRTALTFEIESSLPFDAEQAVADFSNDGNQITGIAIDATRWAPMVDALDAQGVLVEAIVPLPVLAAQTLIEERKAAAGDRLIWSRGDCADLMVLRENSLASWRFVPNGSQRLRGELQAMSEDHPAHENTLWVDQPIDPVRQTDLDEPMALAATRSASLLLQGQSTPWYDLRRGRLAESDPLRSYRDPLRWLTLAIGALLVTTIAMSFWRTARIENELLKISEQQKSVFKTAFPGTRMPAAVISRIRSEHRKSLGSRKTGGAVPTPKSAIKVLDAFLASVPKELRCNVTQVAIRDGELNADIEFRNHAAAGTLAAALEESGFTMLPPSTDQVNPTTVASQLQGTFQEPSSKVNPPSASAKSGTSVAPRNDGDAL
jgi:type II secretory pathway component PulL